MVVTWVTQDFIDESYVEYGRKTINKRAKGTAKLFTNGLVLQRNITIHRVILSGLETDQTYCNHLV